MGKPAESQGVVRAGLEVFEGNAGLLEMRKPESRTVWVRN